MQANAYWRAPYTPMLGSRQLVEFVVLDIELLGPAHGKHALAEAQVIMPDLLLVTLVPFNQVCFEQASYASRQHAPFEVPIGFGSHVCFFCSPLLGSQMSSSDLLLLGHRGMSQARALAS